MHLNKYTSYFYIAFAVVILYFTLKIINPYINALLSSIVLSFIFYPVYRWLHKYIKNKTICSLIVTIALILILLVPSAYILNTIITEAASLYNTDFQTAKDLLIDKLNINLSPEVEESLNDLIRNAVLSIIDLTSEFLLSLPQMFINFFIMVFVFFFSFKDGEKIVKYFRESLPIDEGHKKAVIKKIQTTISSLVYGEIAISLIEGVVAAIGFYLIGVNSPIFFGLIVAIFALLPLIGPTIVYVPLAIYQFMQGEILTGIILLAFGFFVLTLLLDLIVKPKLLGMKGHIHPIIILLGVLGGLSVFGLPGLIIGPVILVLFILIIEIFFEK
ncbi:AI-2E family transporter [archaeon]|jgi:predicted PurR-regulated permease PerM|nr:AI-2E family transporter [archaeon]MBT4416846.1 AI-2E family transporter [archaeon]